MRCAVCDHPRSEHAEAFGFLTGRFAGTINNCGRIDGEGPQSCQMCQGSCYPQHFYTPRVINSFRGPHHFLSNFYPCEVVIYGWTFPSSEHAYQAMKAAYPEKYWPMFLSGTPNQAKRLGKTIPIRWDWESVKVDFMRAIVWDKFTRHPDLMDKLLQTKDATLIEGNTWGDQFWGVCDGVGENWLGRILMDTRSLLPF